MFFNNLKKALGFLQVPFLFFFYLAPLSTIKDPLNKSRAPEDSCRSVITTSPFCLIISGGNVIELPLVISQTPTKVTSDSKLRLGMLNNGTPAAIADVAVILP